MAVKQQIREDTSIPMSRDERLLWRPDIEDPYLVRHMIDKARIVLGLWRYPRLPVLERARLIKEPAGEYMFLNRMLVKSTMAPVKFVKNFGLPISASVEMFGSVQCHKCGARIRFLPCILCTNGVDDDPDCGKEADNDPVPTAEDWQWYASTDLQPGTRPKIELMAERAMRGLPLHHELDRKSKA